MEQPVIMLVEDDLDLAEMVSSYFRVQNYDVLTAAWAEEALKIASESPLDLIILDVRLPDMNGFDLCRELRTNNRKTERTPIIFLTEKRDRGDRLQGLELGVVDYITKPFDIQELRLRVRNIINRASRPATINPVTDLSEGDIIEEKLGTLLTDTSDWAILQLSISQLSKFREHYGFVAADDVLRAVTLMMKNAVKEHGHDSDFIGHIGHEDFVIITHKSNAKAILDRIERRIHQSREYFYPIKDRNKAQKAMTENQLALSSAIINQESGSFGTVKALKEVLHGALHVE
jgi:DNA-binding response OmpR family regulator